MNHVVAFIDQDTCRVYRTREECPPLSLVFSDSNELTQFPTHVLDNMRNRILGQSTPSSSSRAEAASRLWHVLSIGALSLNAGKTSSTGTKLDNFGNPKIAAQKIELIHLSWRRGEDSLIDKFHDKLPDQAKKVVQILTEDGRRVWTLDQALAAVVARGEEIETTQGVEHIFKYYLSKLFLKKILRRVSFAEFSARPEFQAISIAN